MQPCEPADSLPSANTGIIHDIWLVEETIMWRVQFIAPLHFAYEIGDGFEI